MDMQYVPAFTPVNEYSGFHFPFLQLFDTIWAMSYPNLPDGYQHDPKSVQAPYQANEPGLIHDNIGDRSHLYVVVQCCSMRFGFAEQAQPGVIQLAANLDLIYVL